MARQRRKASDIVEQTGETGKISKQEAERARRLEILAEQKKIKNLAEYKKQLEQKNAEALYKEEVLKQRELLKEYYETQAENATKISEKLAYGIKAAMEEYKTIKEEAQEALKDLPKNLLGAIGEQLKAGINKLKDAVEDAASVYSDYMSSINARLQGYRGEVTDTFTKLADSIRKQIGSSPFVKQSAVLSNLSGLVEQGIAYNVEFRAFLESIKDDIATTFSVADSTLLRLIRIQQADSSAVRLGLEASLTQLFNKNFGDTSYLSESFDSISAALLEATSQLTYTESVEFEYVVQKWLGALQSVGVASESLINIARGIGYLGAGDVSSLVGNTELQNILAMSAQRAGLDYSALLTGGLTAQTTNKLLNSMVGYLQEIAGSENLVIKSQYANLFGMTVSDLAAIQKNLKPDTIKSLYNNVISYNNALEEVSRQISYIPQRMHTAEKIENLVENALFSIGSEIVSNSISYATWLVADVLEKTTGGIDIPIPIPFVGVTTLNVASTIKTGLVGYGILTQLGSIIGGIGDLFTGTVNKMLSGYDIDIPISGTGGGFTPVTQRGVAETLSSTMYVGETSGTDIAKQSLVEQQKSTAETISGTEAEVNTEAIMKNVDSNVESISNSVDSFYPEVLSIVKNKIYPIIDDNNSILKLFKDFTSNANGLYNTVSNIDSNIVKSSSYLYNINSAVLNNLHDITESTATAIKNAFIDKEFEITTNIKSMESLLQKTSDIYDLLSNRMAINESIAQTSMSNVIGANSVVATSVTPQENETLVILRDSIDVNIQSILNILNSVVSGNALNVVLRQF